MCAGVRAGVIVKGGGGGGLAIEWFLVGGEWDALVVEEMRWCWGCWEACMAWKYRSMQRVAWGCV
jgi:hypothetical protein